MLFVRGGLTWSPRITVQLSERAFHRTDLRNVLQTKFNCDGQLQAQVAPSGVL
jgi:hypothetical protein